MPKEYTTGKNVTLKVDINLNMFSFAWFYNDTPICVCSCSSHYILSNDSKNLTIVNASATDVGTYEARITSYQIYKSKKCWVCDRVMNELLVYNAAFAPVTYTLSYKGKTVINHQLHVLLLGSYSIYLQHMKRKFQWKLPLF